MDLVSLSDEKEEVKDTITAVQEALDDFAAKDEFDCVRWEIAMLNVIKQLPEKEQARLKVVRGTFNKHSHRFLLVDGKKIVDPTVEQFLKKILQRKPEWEALVRDVQGTDFAYWLDKDALSTFPAGFTSYSNDGKVYRFVYNELKSSSDEIRKFYSW